MFISNELLEDYHNIPSAKELRKQEVMQKFSNMTTQQIYDEMIESNRRKRNYNKNNQKITS